MSLSDQQSVLPASAGICQPNSSAFDSVAESEMPTVVKKCIKRMYDGTEKQQNRTKSLSSQSDMSITDNDNSNTNHCQHPRFDNEMQSMPNETAVNAQRDYHFDKESDSLKDRNLDSDPQDEELCQTSLDEKDKNSVNYSLKDPKVELDMPEDSPVNDTSADSCQSNGEKITGDADEGSDIENQVSYIPPKKSKLCQSSLNNGSTGHSAIKWINHENNGGDMHSVNVTLWQFLLELLISNQYPDIIQWTNQEGEFILFQAEEVARLWGMRKNKNHRMNYDKLSRALRYYYQKNIIKKVHGHKFVYRFVYLPEEALESYRKSLRQGKVKCLVAGESSLPTQTAAQISENCEKSQDNTDQDTWNASLTQSIKREFSEANNNDDFELPDKLFEKVHTEQIKKEAQPCCSCHCHNKESSSLLFNSPNNLSSSHSGHDRKIPRLDEFSSMMQSPSAPVMDNTIHHARHAINMQRLAQQLRLHSKRSDWPLNSTSTTAHQKSSHLSPPLPNYSSESPKPQSSHSTTPPNFPFPNFLGNGSSLPNIPPFPSSEFPSSGTFVPRPGMFPSGFPAPLAGQQCVWMPVPVSMLHIWWQSFAAAAAASQSASTNSSTSTFNTFKESSDQ